jgi:hypothetical protein
MSQVVLCEIDVQATLEQKHRLAAVVDRAARG